MDVISVDCKRKGKFVVNINAIFCINKEQFSQRVLQHYSNKFT